MGLLPGLKKNFCQKSTMIFISCIFMMAWGVHRYSGFTVNLTNSLPYKIFILNKLDTPGLGKYVCFKAPKDSGFPSDGIITKQILGQPGDIVSIKKQKIYINNKLIGVLKKTASNGEKLLPGPEGVINQNQYYVGTPHPDSLDSRYHKIGWIHREEIIAVAYPLF